jgi:PadR family transcriptional regulator, regulatory protein PadR
VAAHEKKHELVQGTLDMLVLKTLARGPMHGYAIARRIQQASSELLKIEEGSLYPALHRMERRGWIEAEWGLSESNRRAKYYALTTAGRAALKDEVAAWDRFVEAVAGVLGASPAET